MTEASKRLPLPKVITKPLSRLQLEVSFTDSEGERWVRVGSKLSRIQEAHPLSASAAEYSRALELLNSQTTASGAKGAKGAFLESLALAATEALAPPDGQKLLVVHVPGYLLHTASTHVMDDRYIEADGIATIAGAFKEIDNLSHYNDIYSADADTFTELAEKTCALHAALAGVRAARGTC